MPLARLDAQGQATEQGGLGTTQDEEPGKTPETIATSADLISVGGLKNHQPHQPAANDAEAQYWEALNAQSSTALRTGTEAKLCDVYYFHADQVGMPQEPSNAQGQLVWQANYKTWGSTVSEEWEVKSLAGQQVHSLDQGDIPTQEESQQQNLRFQGQYLDRETGLHYNTFRYYDVDIGRFICPDPIGLGGGINLGSYSPNPLSWIDPWGWAKCGTERKNRTPSPSNRKINHKRTTKNQDGSTTYYDKKGNAVTYDKNGVPDFSKYAEKSARSKEYNGNRTHDNRVANKKTGNPELGGKAPKGKVWHHVSKDKMILMDKKIHDNFPHTGSASVLIHG